MQFDALLRIATKSLRNVPSRVVISARVHGTKGTAKTPDHDGAKPTFQFNFILSLIGALHHYICLLGESWSDATVNIRVCSGFGVAVLLANHLGDLDISGLTSLCKATNPIYLPKAVNNNSILVEDAPMIFKAKPPTATASELDKLEIQSPPVVW